MKSHLGPKDLASRFAELLNACASLDIYEVALILGACFLVNYVTADNKTNWVEGFVMVSFYIMIVCVPSYILSTIKH